jgi:uncharacterized protein YeeX (DUF496 family)
MALFSREKLASAAKELAEHLDIIQTVRSLQDAQKKIADAIENLEDRIQKIETEMRALKAETALECIRETQSIVNGMQGNLNQRIQDLAVQVATLDSQNLRLITKDKKS